MSPFFSLEGTWGKLQGNLNLGAFVSQGIRCFLSYQINQWDSLQMSCRFGFWHLPLEAGGTGAAQRGWIRVSPAGSCGRRCHHGAGRAHPARTRVAAGIRRRQLTGSPCCLPPSKTHSWFRQSSPFVSCNSVFLSTKIKSAVTESLQLRNILDGF